MVYPVVMGKDVEKTAFDDEDYLHFQQRLEENLQVLETLLARPGFGQGDASLGAELEMYIVDSEGYPLLVNEEILAAANDPLLTLELNRYNLEYNLQPYLLSEQPFINTERDMLQKLQQLDSIAGDFGGRMAVVGILPTLRKEDFGPSCMSDRRRYHALVNQLIQRRGSNFQININGEDPLQLEMNDVTLEGANTSFQCHYRVEPQAFADTYNAFQLMTPLALALAANSPTLFGHSLWQETRIPLFKQSIDVRTTDRYHWHAPPRVNFGNGWLRQGISELLSESVRSYDALLPICDDESPLEALDNDEVPGLHELLLHQSSVWLWNRPVYDKADGGHLRIEMRALPAGPTAIDMVANVALLIGLAEGVRKDINSLLPALPFYLAEYNFYRAAQHGLNARLIWPSRSQYGCEERDTRDILQSLLPVASEGLDNIGIGEDESERYMSVIRDRLNSGQTGAIWQQRCLSQLQTHQPRRQSLHAMLERMLANSASNRPVSEWNVDD